MCYYCIYMIEKFPNPNDFNQQEATPKTELNLEVEKIIEPEQGLSPTQLVEKPEIDEETEKKMKESRREQRRSEIVALAKEINETQESFRFPGINPENYAKIKSEEQQFPGYSTPIDEILEKLNKQGMKVVLGKYPESGNVFILPRQSNDIEMDSLFPRHLKLSEIEDTLLNKLTILCREKI